MNREQEIEKFLKNISDAYKLNPKLIDPDYVYSELNKYMLDLQKGRTNFGKYFDYWQDRYEDNSHMSVFAHPKQPGFLQFQNHEHIDSNDPNLTKYIKLYLSVNPEYISPVVDKIFDYIANNNIITHSKVSEFDRSDSIVLRIKKEEDAKKVIDFINNDEFITEHARPTNPFLVRDGVVGASFDDRLSYNFAVSNLVSNYINERYKLNSASDIGIEDFRKYVKGYFKHTFETCENLESFRNSEYFKRNLNRVRNEFPHEKDLEEALLVNYMHVTNIIGVSLSNGADFGTIEEAYGYSKNQEFNAKYKEKYKAAINSKYNSNELLDEYIRYAYMKYGSNNEMVFNYLNAFLHGNPAGITRDNNFRALFVDNLDRQRILEITNGSPREYIEYVTSNMKFLGYNTYIEACKATYLKYGKEQLIYAIKHSLEGDYNKFTNGGKKLREQLKKYVTQDDIMDYLNNILETYGLEYDEEAILNIADIIEQVEETEPIEKSKTK